MIDRVKFTKEFSSIYGSAWVGMEGTVEPGQTPEQLLEEIISKINVIMGVNTGNYSVKYSNGELPVIQLKNDADREELLKNLHKKQI